jgi:hypothetical protein
VILLALPALAEPTSLLDGAISLEVPASFRVLDHESIEDMFAAASPRPGAVLATPDTETRISFTHHQGSLSEDDLETIMQALHARLGDRVTWLRDEMLTINGTRWFRVDYDVGSGPGAKRETILGASVRYRLLFLVVTSPLEDHEFLSEELEAMLNSLQVNP